MLELYTKQGRTVEEEIGKVGKTWKEVGALASPDRGQRTVLISFSATVFSSSLVPRSVLGIYDRFLTCDYAFHLLLDDHLPDIIQP
jgi:hypothetical protein